MVNQPYLTYIPYMTYIIALALAAQSPAIAPIACGSSYGTAFWLAPDRIVTAAHIASGGPCVVMGHPVRIVRSDPAMDVAELSGLESDAWLEVDCGGFAPRGRYLAVGYPGGRRHSAAVRATRARHDLGGVRRLTWFHGFVYRGMSGGPVLDEQGRASGLVSGIGTPSPLGESSRDNFNRSFSETFVCERI